jgi:hypothetical protein
MNNALRSKPFDLNIGRAINSIINRRAMIFGGIIIIALLAFEVFNYSTTEYALNDVLGSLTFMGIRWATILSIAFCGIDFAGIARLFTPQQGANEPTEVWYLFGAWILAAAMNATLTWWGVSVAIANHTSLGTAVVKSSTIQTVVPIFVAVLVWVIRIMIIGTFSLSGERIFGQPDNRVRRSAPQPQQQQMPARNGYHPQRPNTSVSPNISSSRPILAPASSFKPQPKPMQRTEANLDGPAEPTYHNLASSRQVEQLEKFS